jgi:hypothetical protein
MYLTNAFDTALNAVTPLDIAPAVEFSAPEPAALDVLKM